MHELIYNGTNLKTFGVYVSGENAWAKPAADITRTVVPGRNGDLVTFNNRYNNVDITYHLGIKKNWNESFSDLVSFLLKEPGYHKLVDSSHPGVYRLAMLEQGITPQMEWRNLSGQFDLTFNCKPQTYLDSGDVQQTFTGSGSITNPTLFPAKPYLRVYVNSTNTARLTISGCTIAVKTSGGYVDIDCDLMDAYRGSVNCNDQITLESGRFPELLPGSNGISFLSNVSRLLITPRWWRL